MDSTGGLIILPGMTVNEYNLMNQVKQADVLLEYGVMVAERTYKDFKIILYQVKNFYVEVYFHKTYDMIQGFRAFENLRYLDPFLEEIDIRELTYG